MNSLSRKSLCLCKLFKELTRSFQPGELLRKKTHIKTGTRQVESRMERVAESRTSVRSQTKHASIESVTNKKKIRSHSSER